MCSASPGSARCSWTPSRWGDRCASQGDAGCHLVGRTRQEWGEERADELRFYEEPQLAACLDVSLRRVVDTLKKTEKKLRKHRRALIQVAPEIEEPLVDATVIITGESGAGKERIARLIHDESPRATGPFIAGSCGAMPETLLESELFGHARGAFTGAAHDRPGLCEAASGGTLLLDEVGEVSPGMQVKLLRAPQEREVRRVGENNSRRVDVRLVAATNRDLAQAVASGELRQDQCYRLKVVELHVPPLRERRADILPLARVLLAEAGLRMKRRARGSSGGAPQRQERVGREDGGGAAPGRSRQGAHPGVACAQRWQSDPHRQAAPHRFGDPLSQAREVRPRHGPVRSGRELTAIAARRPLARSI